jgi:hypothetical protein
MGGSDSSSVDFDELERLERQRQSSAAVADATLTPDVPEESPRGVHVHDGFFLRFGFGPSYFNGSYEGGFRQDPYYPQVPIDADVSGVGFTGELAVGGAPCPGLILAARVALTFAPAPVLELSELGDGFSDADLDAVAMPLLGGLMDIYPDAELGIHFFGTVGLTTMELGGDEGVGSKSFIGVGYGGGIGFEGFVSDEWSIGVNARLDAAYLVLSGSGTSTAEDDGDDDSIHLVSPGMQLVFTYN